MIFVDTGAFIARHIKRDQHHNEATRVWRELARSGERCVTSSFVVNEVLTLLGRRAGNHFAAAVGRRLYGSRALEIHRPDREDEIAALGLFEKYADQRVTFTDCICFVLMRSVASTVSSVSTAISESRRSSSCPGRPRRSEDGASCRAAERFVAVLAGQALPSGTTVR